MMTSGRTIGAVVRKENSVFVLNESNLVRTNADIVPRTTANDAEKKPMVSESRTPDLIASLCCCTPTKSSLYQRRENFDHTVTSWESLNEYTISTMIGMYRKKKPSARTISLQTDFTSGAGPLILKLPRFSAA